MNYDCDTPSLNFANKRARLALVGGMVRVRSTRDVEELEAQTQFSLVQSLSHVQLFATPWTAACQASLSLLELTQTYVP